MYVAWDGEWRHGVDGDELATSLEVGDNFVVNAEEGNNEGQEFWIMCYTKPLHKLNGPLNCKWGMNYNERDEVVVGKYCEKWGNSYSTYVLLKDSHVVYLYSHLVRVVKFLMRLKNHSVFGNDSLYELLSDATTGIQSIIVALDDVD
jgi:hypothetical protein